MVSAGGEEAEEECQGLYEGELPLPTCRGYLNGVSSVCTGVQREGLGCVHL